MCLNGSSSDVSGSNSKLSETVTAIVHRIIRCDFGVRVEVVGLSGRKMRRLCREHGEREFAQVWEILCRDRTDFCRRSDQYLKRETTERNGHL